MRTSVTMPPPFGLFLERIILTSGSGASTRPSAAFPSLSYVLSNRIES